MNKILTLIEKLRLNTKLIIGFGLGILIAALIGIYSIVALDALQSNMKSLYEDEMLGVSHIKEANINLIYMDRAVRQMMIAQDDLERDKARARVQKARETINEELAQARQRIFRAEVIARYEQFKRNFTKYNENVEHALALIEREKINPSAAAQFVSTPDFATTVNTADDDLTAMTKIKEQASKDTIDAARQRVDDLQRTTVLIMVLGAVLAMGLGALIGASIKWPNDRLRQSVKALAAGKVDTPIPHVDYPNEIGVMARAIKVLQEIYLKADEQHWIKTHAAEIASKLQQAEDFHTLTQTAVSRLAPAVGAGHGAFYVADTQATFNLLASYGYRERKHLSNSYRMGEGLVGQCAMEKSPIMLTAPKDYIRISSGLGEGPPACILVLPIMHGDRVLGVLEMASFQTFTEREKAVLEALVPVLGTSMEILDRNLRTKELLAATQEQAERMEKQAAQLEEQTVEMEAQQAELLETESWFRSIIETAPDGMLVVDASGHILLSNPNAERLFAYAPGELAGVLLGQLLPSLDISTGQDIPPTDMNAQDKGGQALRVRMMASVLPDRGGRGRCVSLSVRAA